MSINRRLLLIGIGTATVAGCIGDNDDTDDDVAPDADDESEDDDGGMEPENTVAVAEHAEYGEILVDGDGLTLYMFDQDEQGAAESTCYDNCAGNWPPLTVTEEPDAGEAVRAQLTTFEREGEEESQQVAAAGWPLYYWVGDDEPGDVNGQGVQDVWWVLDADGTPLRDGEDEHDTDSDGDDYGDDSVEDESDNGMEENGDDYGDDSVEDDDDGGDYGYGY